MSKEQRRSYLVELAMVLIYLRGANVSKVAKTLGISESGIKGFLSRTRLSLSPEHATKFYYHLGIGKNSKGEPGLLSQCVHHYRLDLSRQDAAAMVDILRPLLPGVQATLLPFADGRTRVILMKTATARVVLQVKSGLFQRQQVGLSLLGLSDCEVAYPSEAETIPQEYKTSIFSGQIGLVDFDALFDATFPDWNTIRRVANSHNIAYAEIIHFMKERSRTSRGLTQREYQGLGLVPGGNQQRPALLRHDQKKKITAGAAG
jgi:hypothetical protein